MNSLFVYAPLVLVLQTYSAVTRFYSSSIQFDFYYNLAYELTYT
jgi:hypothetical protein